MELLNIKKYTHKEILDLIITNGENNLNHNEFRILKNKKLTHIGELKLESTHYTLYKNKDCIIAVRASESLFKTYKKVYYTQYPTKQINTIRDLKNFIKDIAEKKNDKELHKRAKDLSFKLGREYLLEIEKGKNFIYKDNEFKPKGSE